MQRFAVPWVCASLVLSVVAGCQTPEEGPTGNIEIDGSSTVFKLTQAVAEEFHGDNASVHVKVDKSGTGGGFKNFVLGKLDICDASRPIAAAEIEKCKANGV